MYLSVVIPIYNEEPVINELISRLENITNLCDFKIEFIFVDDGSSDLSLNLLKDYSSRNNNFKIISFTRNFGHQIAITAGLEKAKGEYVAIIDADLQDPPELILEMLDIATNQYDIVYAVRTKRIGESQLKLITAKLFYRLIGYLCDVDIPNDTGDFRVMSRRSVNQFLNLKEKSRFVRGMIPWLGFKSKPFYYERKERFAGQTKYPLKKMLKFAKNAIISFSTKPITLAINLGVIAILVSFILMIYMLYIKLFTLKSVPGITSITVLVIFLSGIQLFTLGILGEYIARIYEEIKGRPLYIINEEINY